jgi:hypothetical protein
LTSSVGDIKPAFRACTTVGFDNARKSSDHQPLWPMPVSINGIPARESSQ